MLNKPCDTQHDKALAIIVKTTSIGEGIALSVIRVFQLEHSHAGRVVVKRRIETKRANIERRSLGFDTPKGRGKLRPLHYFDYAIKKAA